MRTSAISSSAIGMLIALATTAPADAREYPWCLQFGSRLPLSHFAMLTPSAHSDSANVSGLLKQAQDSGGGRNCGFDTYDQCMAARNGIGGFCERNLFYQGEPERPVRPRGRERRDR
jgi:hypothetical protein